MEGFEKLCDGVYVCDPSDQQIPDSFVADEAVYTSFMDYFYICVPSEELTSEQVHEICSRRRLNREWAQPGSVNSTVRGVFKSLVRHSAPSVLLEIGPGDSPLLLTSESGTLRYITADTDPSMVAANAAIGYESHEFVDLPLNANSVDLVIAVFVLQFRFDQEELDEISRMLNDRGVFAANVYRRSKESRDRLKSMVLKSGMQLRAIGDSSELCRDHEYWIAGRDDLRLAAGEEFFRGLFKKSSL